MEANEMIDRYVHEVGQRLPRKSRADIEMELRSLLLDSLEEKSDGEPSAQAAADVLREFGHPEEIANQYRPAESLIGPKLFPTYRLVISIAVAIIGGLHLLGLGFVLWQNGPANVVDQTLSFFVSFGRSVILNAGVVTLIFAIIERVAADSLAFNQTKARTWDPFQLPPVQNMDRVNRAELAVGIFFSLLFLAWLNYFPGWFGGLEIGEEVQGIFILVTAEMIAQIPWITASLLLEVALKTAVLLQGRWLRLTRWLELAISGFGLYVAYRIFSLEAIATVPFFNTIAKSILVFVLIIGLVEMVIKLFRLLLGRPILPVAIFKSKIA